MPLSWCWFQWTRQRRTPSRSLRTAVFRISRKPASGDARMHHWITVIRIAEGSHWICFKIVCFVNGDYAFLVSWYIVYDCCMTWCVTVGKNASQKYRQRMGRKSREKKKRRRTQQHRFCTDLLNSTMAWVGPFWKHTMFSRWYCY